MRGFIEFIMDFLPIILPILFISGIVWIIVTAASIDNRLREERNAFKAKCIDAGGYPVTPWDYVKGHGEGYLCINPSAIIQLKDEPNEPSK